MKSVIWKSEEGRERLEKWYQRFLSKIPSDHQSVTVPTRFGDSHVLQAGNADGPTLICLHAMRTGAAFLLAELGPLLPHFRVIAPDLPGQSVRGLDLRLSLKDNSHSDWLNDILDYFDIDCASVLGVSWGGFVARLAVSTTPQRFNKLALLVPAGIANGSHLTGLAKMLFPMIKYRMKPSEVNLKNLLAPILTNWDDDWGNFIGCSLRDMKIDRRIPPLASDADLKQLNTPTLVLAADQDISFPGKRVVERVNRLVPNVHAEIIPDCKHCPPSTDEFREWLAKRITDFLKQNDGEGSQAIESGQM